MPVSPALDTDQIQGNVLGGFNKDHQTFLFLQFTDPALARAWLRLTTTEVATTAEVSAFNTAFKKIHRRRGHASNVVQATWMNLAFTSPGLLALGVGQNEIDTFPAEFREGLAAHAANLGHVGSSAPETWRPAFRTAGTIHAVMIIAADDPDDLQDAIERFMESMGRHGVEVVDRLDGDTRSDEKGHEHFGFKDGISQPTVLGFPRSTPDAGTGHLDPIQPGEFIIGYPTEPATPNEPEPMPPTMYGQAPPPPPPTPEPGHGPDSATGPAWTKDGSFLVIERLAQNVKAFDEETAAQAAAAGFADVELFRSKLVGRHKSGCPMEQVAGNPDTSISDIGLTDPSVLASDKDNDFGYAADPDGTTVPRGAHIRKTNPRDGIDVPGGVASVRAHRILRRGITYGGSYNPTAPAGSPGHAEGERGLIFACYQGSIQRGFEFIQQNWVNNPGFTQAGDGADPILSEDGTKPFNLPGAATTPVETGGWITMTGGEYFFQPSLAALEALSSDPAV